MSNMTSTFNATLTPLDRKLLGWLDTDSDRFEKYIAAHPEAGDRIGQLVELGADVQQVLRRAIAEAAAVPIDFAERMAVLMQPDRDTGAGSLLMDIFSVGFSTMNVWVSPR
jgi:hypothetical protein